VDVIEAGFPIGLRRRLEAVQYRRLAAASIIAGLARAVPATLTRLAGVAGAAVRASTVFLGSSDII